MKRREERGTIEKEAGDSLSGTNRGLWKCIDCSLCSISVLKASKFTGKETVPLNTRGC